MADNAYRPSRAGVAKFLRSPQISAALLAIAENGKTYAESISPRETGDYASSWKVSRSTFTVKGEPRAAAKLENTSGHAAAVEFGYAGRANRPGQSRHRVLGRTLEHMRRG